jgi:hypothetical protein
MSIKDRIGAFIAKVDWHFDLKRQERNRRNRPYDLVWAMSAEDSAKFITENLSAAVLYQHRTDFWQFVLKNLPAEGVLIEVGVFRGVSINFIADDRKRRGDQRLVHGFDSFEGLEEDWSGEGLAEGYFNQGGKLPEVRDNVRLYKGWVKDTLGPFLTAEGQPRIGLVHIDTDTYTPAAHVLELVVPLLAPGSIIVFDELIGYPNWREHEYKALNEWLPRDRYDFIAFTSRQAALRIKG